MADAAISYAIAKADEFCTEQSKIRRGVPDGIEWLKEELHFLLNSVTNLANEETENVRLWTGSVIQVADEATTVLERLVAQQEKQGGVLYRTLNFFKKEANLFDIGRDINSLQEKVNQIRRRKDEYGIIATQEGRRRKRTLLRAASFEHEKNVVGFDDDIQTLLAQLCNGDPLRSLIAIHGMGGLGKTTLASKLYHSRKLSHFKHRAWVCVSEEYDITNVLRKIIRCFKRYDQQDSSNKMEEVELLRQMEEVELRQHLRTILLDRDQYLVVIDDIWDVLVWKKIENAFPDKKNGSRVIITTRNQAVAEGADATCFVHQLRFLREDESWELFCKRAELLRIVIPPNMEELGKDVVHKCGGLPLAIVILSGLLLQNMTDTFWSEVKGHLWRKLKGESTEIEEILNLSYDDLSSQMRRCFLYLARYPEDYALKVFDLKLLWIAEDFVSKADVENGVDMEDVAEDSLIELINRNMIQIHLRSVEGQVLECRVHDLVRDLSIKKAREQKILSIFDSSKRPISDHWLQVQARHVIYNGIGEYLKVNRTESNDLNLRSLSVITLSSKLELEEMKMMSTRYKYLKVIDFRSSVVDSKAIPKVIGDLILLQYLGLMANIHGKPIAIPASIGKLKKLQTLCGSGDYKFPREIDQLKELRHFIFKGLTWFSVNLRISSHQNKLQTLRSISPERWLEIDTVDLTNLRALFITGSIRNYSLESMAKLTSLRTLSLSLLGGSISTIQPLSSCKHLMGLQITGELKDAAELTFLPDSITELQLVYTDLKEDPMPTLGRLPNLIALSLGPGVIHSVDKMVCSEDAFPSLQSLSLNHDRSSALREIQVDDRALPCLKSFSADRSVITPQRIASLPLLRILTLPAYEFSVE